jgi:hypothetical protein
MYVLFFLLVLTLTFSSSDISLLEELDEPAGPLDPRMMLTVQLMLNPYKAASLLSESIVRFEGLCKCTRPQPHFTMWYLYGLSCRFVEKKITTLKMVKLMPATYPNFTFDFYKSGNGFLDMVVEYLTHNIATVKGLFFVFL